MSTGKTLTGKPYAGNPHVRFDEGKVASVKPRRGSLLYKMGMHINGLLLMALAVVGTTAFAAEDKTVAYGETLDITEDTTYLNLVVNGTLNVAEGKNLTCDTFILGDNLDHTQDRVAKMTVASNATVKVNNSETLSGGSYTSTGYCKIGVNSRAELTLEGGSTFTAGGRMIVAPGCTGTVDKVVYVKVTLNDAALVVNGPLQFQGTRSHANAIENAVFALNGTKAIVQPCNVYMDENSASARIKFSGGKLTASGSWNYGQQAVLRCMRNKQKLWLESVGGNPIWLSGNGGNNTRSFFYANNPSPFTGSSYIYFEGVGPLVLECDKKGNVESLCWDNTLPQCIDIGQIDCVRLRGGVTLENNRSASLASNILDKVKLELAAGSSLDVCGVPFDIAELESAGTIVNSGASDAVLTVGGSNGDVILSSPTLSEGVKLVKVGTGKLYAPAGPLANIEVRSGSFDFCDRASVGFPYYRYWVYGKSKGGGDNGGHCGVVRLCEMELYNGDVNVSDQATHVSWVREGVNDRSPKNLFTADTAESWRSWWYSKSAEDLRPSNCVFAVIHMGGAPSFPFTGLAPYFPSSVPAPVFEAIDNRPAVTKINEIVTSYRYRLHSTQYYSYTNPEYFRFQGGLGDDTWIDLENWEARGRYTKLTYNDSYNWSEEFPLTYPTNAVSVGQLELADGVEWTLDAAQTDLTVGTLSIAGSGTLRIKNLGNVRGGTPLPVRFTSIVGERNLAHWNVYLDGVLFNLRICAENGMLAFARRGMVVYFK